MNRERHSLLEPKKRATLLLKGMKNIDRFQQKMTLQSRESISYKAFVKRAHLQFEKSLQEYKKNFKRASNDKE